MALKHAPCIALALALTPAASPAGDLVVDAQPCAKTIHVRATAVPLQDVLSGLAGAMHFKLHIQAELGEAVTLDREASPETLIKDLMRGHNLVLDTNPAKACDGRQTIATVWILPAGTATAATTGTTTVFGLGPHPSFSRRKNHWTDEEWHRLKEDWKAGRIRRDPETGAPVPVEAAN